MKHAKIRSIIAIIGLMCMAVFVPLLIAIFAFPRLADGPLGWIALVTGLIGVGTCIAVRFLFRDGKKGRPSYLPEDENGGKDADDSGAEDSDDSQGKD